MPTNTYAFITQFINLKVKYIALFLSIKSAETQYLKLESNFHFFFSLFLSMTLEIL